MADSSTNLPINLEESLIKSLGSSVRPCVPCGSRSSMVLNQSFLKEECVDVTKETVYAHSRFGNRNG